jgi:hypothetical protein
MGEDYREFSIPLQLDENGYLGRECPQPDCKGYFKVTPGTGLSGISDCYCPYCGHRDESTEFATEEQKQYALSVASNQIFGELFESLKAHEFDYQPRGNLGIGFSLKVTGTPPPIRYYREKQLETEIICNRCTLRYAIYGVFAFCPDCGVHNSQQILEKNLELAEKEAALAGQVDAELSAHLIADALENEVSAFDGFGRQACKLYAAKASNANRAERLSFQSLTGAQRNLQELFAFDLASTVSPDEWSFALRCFQKRHLLAHKMVVIDEDYVRLAGDPQAVLGRKVSITSEEVTTLASILKKLGAGLTQHLASL